MKFGNTIKEHYLKIKNEEKWKWTLIPYTFLLIAGFILFLCTTFNEIDSKWTDALFQWNWNWQPIRYFNRFMFTLGTNQLTVIIPITALVMIESIFLTKFKKYYNLIYIIYAGFAIFWVVFHTWFVKDAYDGGSGYTPDVFDCEFFVPKNIYFITTAIIIGINTVLFAFLAWWVNQRLAKKEYFLQEKYWLKCIEFVSFVIITYIIATLLKQATGRPEYIYDHYEQVFGNLNFNKTTQKYDGIDNITDLVKSIPGVLDENGNVKQSVIQAIIDAANAKIPLKPAPYFEWWQINGNFFKNLQFWLPWSEFINPDYSQMPVGWNIRNFPSGHIIATMALSAYGYIFIYNKHFNKSSKIAFTIIWFLDVLAMGFSLVISGVHWISDVSFTLVNGGIWYIYAPILTDKVVDKIQIRNERKKNKKNGINISIESRKKQKSIVKESISK